MKSEYSKKETFFGKMQALILTLKFFIILGMRIGYPCINLSINCKADRRFRLQNLTEDKFDNTVLNNLECLRRILLWNLERGILFFRITSNLIPFASHRKNPYDWEKKFSGIFKEIAFLINHSNIRISMHPGQFTVINSPKDSVVENALQELHYHLRLFKLLEVDSNAKIQIHVGGVYGDKQVSIDRFLKNYEKLPSDLKKHLVIENDEKNYTISECIKISKKCGVPVVLDVLHHELNGDGMDILEAFLEIQETWHSSHGPPIVDYSSPSREKRHGAHNVTLDEKHFISFLEKFYKFKFDLMLELKDKEKSALKALQIINQRFPNIKPNNVDTITTKTT